MEKNDLNKLKDALHAWAETAENPDAPAIQIGSSTLSIEQLAREVELGTNLGKEFVAMTDLTMQQTKDTVDDVISRMTLVTKPKKKRGWGLFR